MISKMSDVKRVYVHCKIRLALRALLPPSYTRFTKLELCVLLSVYYYQRLEPLSFKIRIDSPLLKIRTLTVQLLLKIIHLYK